MQIKNMKKSIADNIIKNVIGFDEWVQNNKIKFTKKQKEKLDKELLEEALRLTQEKN